MTPRIARRGPLPRGMSEVVWIEPVGPIPTAIKLPDMPEYADVTDKELQEHIENRKGGRCQGYVDRMLAYEARTGRNICPI